MVVKNCQHFPLQRQQLVRVIPPVMNNINTFWIYLFLLMESRYARLFFLYSPNDNQNLKCKHIDVIIKPFMHLLNRNCTIHFVCELRSV